MCDSIYCILVYYLIRCSTLQCPTYSGGLLRTPELSQIVTFRSPQDSNESCRSLQESPGVCRSLQESAGVSRSLPESAGVSRSLQESPGVCRTPADSARLNF